MTRDELTAALIDAVKNGHLDDTKVLVGKGADVNAVNRDGNTPLHVAARNGYADIAEFLVASGAAVNARNRDGTTPLHQAALCGEVAIVEFLVGKGADVTVANRGGETPLHLATRYYHAAILEFLTKAQKSTQVRRAAVKTLLQEDDTIRQRLGIRGDLDLAPEFDVERLIRLAITKREAADPSLRADVEAGVAFHIDAAMMLDGDEEGEQTRRDVENDDDYESWEVEGSLDTLTIGGSTH